MQNVKFKNSTRNIYLLVTLMIPTFANDAAGTGREWWNWTNNVANLPRPSLREGDTGCTLSSPNLCVCSSIDVFVAAVFFKLEFL